MSRGLDHIDESRVAGDGSEIGGFVTGGATEFTLLAGDSLDLVTDDERPKPRWPVAWFAFAAVFALVGATALILPRLAPVIRGQDGAGAPAGSRGYMCAEDARDKDYCRRYGLDLSRRADLPADERNRMLPETTALGTAVSAVRAPADHSPAAEADALRSALVDAGYPEVVVRPARPDDPAPHGSLLFAVPLGDDCFVGHRQNLDSSWSYVLAGRLPDGTCLSR